MFEPDFANNWDGTYTVSATCECGTTTTANVQTRDVFAWRQGAFAQEAFPLVPASDREHLFISGICPDCWDRMFSEGEAF